MAINNILASDGVLRAAPTVSWWWVLASWAVFVSPWGRMAVSAAAARVLLRGVVPGSYPRSGEVHLRLWLAEQISVHIGHVRVGPGATVGSRSTLMPGTRIGAGAEIAPGSAVLGKVKANQRFAGSPAQRLGKAQQDWPAPPPATAGARLWFPAYALASALLATIPYISAAAGALVVVRAIGGQDSLAASWPVLLWAVPVAAVIWFLSNMILIAAIVRLLGLGLAPGHYRVRSLTGWRVWATERVLDIARDLLFPLYASLFTPVWLRLLGATIGKNMEAPPYCCCPR